MFDRIPNGPEGTRYLFNALAKLPVARQQNVSSLYVSRGRNTLQNEPTDLKRWNDMEHAIENELCDMNFVKWNDMEHAMSNRVCEYSVCEHRVRKHMMFAHRAWEAWPAVVLFFVTASHSAPNLHNSVAMHDACFTASA